MTFRFFAASISSAVILVPLRITQPSYAPQISFSASFFRPSLTSTSKPSAFLNTSSPSGASESVTKIFILRFRFGSCFEDRRLQIEVESDTPSLILDLLFSLVLSQRLHEDFLCGGDAAAEGNLGAELSERHLQGCNGSDDVESAHVAD